MKLVSKEGIHKTVTDFTAVISQLNDQQINQVPFEGSWTAGEVAGHLLRSLKNTSVLLSRNTEKADRPADEKVQKVIGLFSDASVKMKNPEFTAPEKSQYTKEEILEGFEKIEKDLTESVETLDLGMICKGFELPGFGPFSRLEWITFYLTHVERHTGQLKRIKSMVSMA
jgi:hypothetical protein